MTDLDLSRAINTLYASFFFFLFLSFFFLRMVVAAMRTVKLKNISYLEKIKIKAVLNLYTVTKRKTLPLRNA